MLLNMHCQIKENKLQANYLVLMLEDVQIQTLCDACPNHTRSGILHLNNHGEQVSRFTFPRRIMIHERVDMPIPANPVLAFGQKHTSSGGDPPQNT